MKKLIRKCPVCQCKEGEFIISIKSSLSEAIKLPEQYDVVCCEKCGFTFADTTASQEDYNRYYSSHNIYSKSAEVKTSAIEEAVTKRYHFLDRFLNKNQRILDIGCGSGSLLMFLKEQGYHSLYGIDPSKQSIKRLNEAGIDGCIGNIFDTAPTELQYNFDVVLCTAVIEHIYSLDKFVECLSQYLNPETGRIYLDAPAVEGFQKYITRLPNYFNQEHINYFSAVSMDNLLKQRSFERITTEEECYYVIDSNPPELGFQAMYEKNINMDQTLIYDKAARESITHYLDMIETEDKKRKLEIMEFVRSNPRIIIWGTGSFAMQLLAEFPEIKEHVPFYIDSNKEKWGGMLHGKEVYLPEHLSEEYLNIPIMICCMQNVDEIVEEMKRLGIRNKYFIA